MSFLGQHLTTIDYVVWALWLAWAVGVGLLVNACVEDITRPTGDKEKAAPKDGLS